jgi:hypothetical protein
MVRARPGIVFGVAAVVAAALYFALRSPGGVERGQPSVLPSARSPAGEPYPSVEVDAEPARERHVERHVEPRAELDARASELSGHDLAAELGLADPSDPNPDAAVLPHPLSPERLRDSEQLALFGQVHDAIRQRDATRARELVREHRARFPGDEQWRDHVEAYEIIADCIEYPGPESRAAGQRFVDEQRGSTMRRRVRRACLGQR